MKTTKRFIVGSILQPVLLVLFFTQINVPIARAGTVIAVVSDSTEATSLISTDVVHGAYYLIFADTGEFLEVLENPVRGQADGAATGADFLVRHKVGVVIAEGFGPEVAQAMEARGIKPVISRGIAREAVRRFVPDEGKVKSKGETR